MSTVCSGSIAPGTYEEDDAIPVIRMSDDGLLLVIGAKDLLYIFSIRMGGQLVGKIEGVHDPGKFISQFY